MLCMDYETTGLLKPDAAELHLQPEIIEVYVCDFDIKTGKINKEFESYVKPLLPISEVITKITDITDQDVKKAPSFIEIYDKMCGMFLGQEYLFAHNCSFEIGVTICELERHDLAYKFPWPKNQICTVEASYAIENKRLNLDKLYQIATGKPRSGQTHRAKKDVVDLIECIVWLNKEGYIKL